MTVRVSTLFKEETRLIWVSGLMIRYLTTIGGLFLNRVEPLHEFSINTEASFEQGC